MNGFFNAETQRRRVAEIGFLSAWMFSCAALAIAADAQELVPPAPLAMVGETPISADAVRAMAARNGYAVGDAATAERALQETIDFEVLAAEAEKAGYFNDPDIVRTIKSMAVQKLVSAKVDKENPPDLLTEEQLVAYYKEHVEEFTRPSIAKGRVLMVLKDRASATNKVAEIEASLEKRTAFHELVREHSDDAASRANAGVTPWLVEKQQNRRYPPVVVDALFALTTAQTVSPKIETDDAWYWVQLLELRSGGVTPYETAKQTIARKLAERERREAYSAYVKGLKGTIPVAVDPLAVTNLLKGVAVGDAPPRGPVSVKMEK